MSKRNFKKKFKKNWKVITFQNYQEFVEMDPGGKMLVVHFGPQNF